MKLNISNLFCSLCGIATSKLAKYLIWIVAGATLKVVLPSCSAFAPNIPAQQSAWSFYSRPCHSSQNLKMIHPLETMEASSDKRPRKLVLFPSIHQPFYFSFTSLLAKLVLVILTFFLFLKQVSFVLAHFRTCILLLFFLNLKFI